MPVYFYKSYVLQIIADFLCTCKNDIIDNELNGIDIIFQFYYMSTLRSILKRYVPQDAQRQRKLF